MKTNLLKLAFCALAVLPMGAWAAEKTNVTGFEMWTFDQYHAGENISALTNYGQLYLRGGSSDGHGITITGSSAVSVTFNYGIAKAFKVGNFALIPANSYATIITSQIKDNFVARNAVGNASDRSFALDAGVAGKVYMWVRASNVPGADGKKIYAAVTNGSSGSSSNYATSSEVHTFTSTETNPFEISFNVDAGKSYMFISDAAFRLYAVAFVPTGYDFTNAGSNRRRVSFGDNDYVTFTTDYPCVLDKTRFDAYYASASDGSTVTLTEYSGSTLAANVPVVLKYKDGVAKTDIGMRLSDSQGTVIAPADNLLKPVYADTYALPATYDTYTNYILAKQGDDYVFAPSSGEGAIQNWFIAKNSSNYLNVGKAYLSINGSSSAPALGIAFNSDVTDVKSITSPNAEGSNEYYNLAGLRVAKPTKGLYIVNGKKVIIK